MIAAIAWFVAGFGTACVLLFAVALYEDEQTHRHQREA